MKVLVVTNMYPIPEMPSFGTFVREQVESLKRQGVQVDVFFVNGRKSAFNYLPAFPRFWAHLLTHRYDLIHSHYLFVSIMARTQFLYPLVTTQHSGEAYNKWQRRLSMLINPFVDRIIAVSEDTKTKGHLNGAVVIPCGVDFNLFKPMPRAEARQLLGLPADKKLVLWAGEHFRKVKRFDIVQEAIALLQKRMPEAELVLVSGKPLSEVPAYMNACDVLLLVSDKEGSPQVVKEAMACNLPVVSVPAGDVPEVIANVEGCYLCSQDPRDAAEKLELVLKWGKRTDGRNKTGQMEIDTISRRIMAVYEELLREKRGRGLGRLWFWQKNNGKVQEA
ncbi:MAG: glycosyltransferase [Chloroflexi bacterium]|nr:glycosyltransferase [Chloroflexota bacterium]